MGRVQEENYTRVIALAEPSPLPSAEPHNLLLAYSVWGKSFLTSKL